MSEVRLVAMRFRNGELLSAGGDAERAWEQGITEEEARALRESTTAPLHPDPAWTYARRKLRAAYTTERERCPTCGSDDPAVTGNLNGWGIPDQVEAGTTCPDPFHTDKGEQERVYVVGDEVVYPETKCSRCGKSLTVRPRRGKEIVCPACVAERAPQDPGP